MQYDGAKGGTAHPRIRNAHHVFHALSRKLHRNRQISCLGHPGRTFWPCVAQDKNVVCVDVEILQVDACGHIFDGIEYHRPAGMMHQVCGGCRLLYNCADGRKIAMKHRHRTFFLQRRGESADNILFRHRLGVGNRIANCATGDGGRIDI